MNKFYGSSVIFADDFLYQIYEKDGKEYSKIPQDTSAYNWYYVKLYIKKYQIDEVSLKTALKF